MWEQWGRNWCCLGIHEGNTATESLLFLIALLLKAFSILLSNLPLPGVSLARTTLSGCITVVFSSTLITNQGWNHSRWLKEPCWSSFWALAESLPWKMWLLPLRIPPTLPKIVEVDYHPKPQQLGCVAAAQSGRILPYGNSFSWISLTVWFSWSSLWDWAWKCQQWQFAGKACIRWVVTSCNPLNQLRSSQNSLVVWKFHHLSAYLCSSL